MIERAIATWTLENGIRITAEIGGVPYTLENLQEIVDSVGSEPGASLDVAWPGQGHKNAEAALLERLGVLNHGGSIGGGMTATAGPRCADFCGDAYNEERWDTLRKKIRNVLYGMNLPLSWTVAEEGDDGG